MTKKIIFKASVIDSLLSYAQNSYPDEGILLLRGKVRKYGIEVENVILPPFAIHGRGFSSFPLHTLPLDLSILGTAHSHPSGTLQPSVGDLNNFYGRIMIIIAYPYKSEDDIGVFDREGNMVKFSIIR
ncbi:MAG: Mov34/MPN/PAD-1 family protein [Candidatus Methylarchaceae archaeon HK02M1]|nr:Mov34/MPN/PAD-1 family protein [Candidatus Methylarchaceae archaeon HK01M]MCP8312627.1 Mov34/MPN/PAD-1 family protein [Candidatus Methylarchaceae archaeon HK02M1]